MEAHWGRILLTCARKMTFNCPDEMTGKTIEHLQPADVVLCFGPRQRLGPKVLSTASARA